MSEKTEKLVKFIISNENVNAKEQLREILKQKVSEKINQTLDN